MGPRRIGSRSEGADARHTAGTAHAQHTAGTAHAQHTAGAEGTAHAQHTAPTPDTAHVEPHHIACVYVPALPLQLLLRAQPDWRVVPVAVVEEDLPNAKVLWVNGPARRRRVRPGMRYSEGLQLSRDLRAQALDLEQLRAARAKIVHALTDFSPRVEADREDAGLYWLDPSGLGSLFGPPGRWARLVHEALARASLRATVVVGFARYLAWAVAMERDGAHVLDSPEQERRLAGQVTLDRLDLSPELRAALAALRVLTLADFVALPRSEVSRRFGPDARAQHERLSGAFTQPFVAEVEPAPICVEAEFDPPDDDRHRLLFCIRGALCSLMRALAARSLGLFALHLHVDIERAAPHTERIEPAYPTRDASAVLELIRLALARLELAGPVTRIHLRAEGARLGGTQLWLPIATEPAAAEPGTAEPGTAEPGTAENAATQTNTAAQKSGGDTPNRSAPGSFASDPEAAQRGVARLKAAFGPASVVRAELRDAWCPERAFRWVPTSSVSHPNLARSAGLHLASDRSADGAAGREGDQVVAESTRRYLVRRVLSRPEPLPYAPHGPPPLSPPIRHMAGPYRIQTGWWEQEHARDYFYAEQADGRILWLFRERRHARWFLHGYVD